MSDKINISLERIDYFIATENNVDTFFNKIIYTALSHEFNDLTEQIITGEKITNSIFKLKASDRLCLGGRIVNGQRISELFILSIYLKYLCKQFPNKTLFGRYPFS